MPNNGLLISPVDDENLNDVLSQGCWSPVEKISVQPALEVQWHVDNIEAGESAFDVYYDNKCVGHVKWALSGKHNVSNALGGYCCRTSCGCFAARSNSSVGYISKCKT